MIKGKNDWVNEVHALWNGR